MYPVRNTPIAITISNPDVFTATVSCGTSTVCAGSCGVGDNLDSSAWHAWQRSPLCAVNFPISISFFRFNSVKI
jgi:hypothetical protein